MSFVIEELPIPVTAGAPGWDDFARTIEVGNRVEEISYGTPDLAYEPEEELSEYLNPFRPSLILVARLDGVIVARATADTQAGEDADTSWATVEVLPEFEGRGIGRALADALEQKVRGDGTTKIIAYVGDADLGGERWVAPTGFGSVRAGSRSARFLQARGYRFEQVERVSRLPLPIPDVTARLTAAEAQTGPEYRVHTWRGRTPERWIEDFAVLFTRMSTDVPSAGLEDPEDVWTVERVIEADDRRESNPRQRLVAAVEHVASGRLVGFSTLSVAPQPHRAVMQYMTIVLREHRGHRLGMLIKLANLAQLQREFPGHPSVVTFNAEENRPMLDVNEALGFVEIGAEGAWRKDLT